MGMSNPNKFPQCFNTKTIKAHRDVRINLCVLKCYMIFFKYEN